MVHWWAGASCKLLRRDLGRFDCWCCQLIGQIRSKYEIYVSYQPVLCGIIESRKDWNNMVENYCTTRDAAKLLGVSLRTAQQWLEKG